jgi:hypothetical protein
MVAPVNKTFWTNEAVILSQPFYSKHHSNLASQDLSSWPAPLSVVPSCIASAPQRRTRWREASSTFLD